MYMEPRGTGNPVLDERIQKQNLKKHKLRVSAARRKGDPASQARFVGHNLRTINNAKAV